MQSEGQSVMHTTNRHGENFDVFSEKQTFGKTEQSHLLKFANWVQKIQIFDIDGEQRPIQACNNFRIKLNQQLGRGA